jgi:hypothetical protein
MREPDIVDDLLCRYLACNMMQGRRFTAESVPSKRDDRPQKDFQGTDQVRFSAPCHYMFAQKKFMLLSLRALR